MIRSLKQVILLPLTLGAVYKGYHSDMTRTIVMGSASELQKKLYGIVLEAQKRGVAAVRARYYW